MDTSDQDMILKLFAMVIASLGDERFEQFYQVLTAERTRRTDTTATDKTSVSEPLPTEEAERLPVNEVPPAVAAAPPLATCGACQAPGDPTRSHTLGTAEHPIT